MIWCIKTYIIAYVKTLFIWTTLWKDSAAQKVKIIWWNSIRYRSDVKVWSGCLGDVNLKIFAFREHANIPVVFHWVQLVCPIIWLIRQQWPGVGSLFSFQHFGMVWNYVDLYTVLVEIGECPLVQWIVGKVQYTLNLTDGNSHHLLRGHWQSLAKSQSQTNYVFRCCKCYNTTRASIH